MGKGNGEKSRLTRWTLWGVPIVGAGIFFVAGIVFWGGFNTAMEATNTLSFCISCHEMRDTVYQEYKNTIHYQNRTGVRATCSDCHVPDPWVHKFIRKVQATNELYHKLIGSIDTPEKFDKRRLTLARHVWDAMKATDSRECRNCHTIESMNPEFQRPRARKQHLNAFKTGQTCIDCHKGIAHKNLRDRVPEDELEALEKPNPAFARPVPKSFLEGLKRIEAKEAAEAERKKAEAEAAEAAVKARIAQAVAAAVAKAKAEMAKAAPGAQGAAAASAEKAGGSQTGAGAVDWNAVPTKTVTLFYPGQASFEWVQTGKDHGGARPFTKGGDRCASCHIKEVKDMGAKIVSGEKAEPTPIPGKRAYIDMTVQAAYDDKNLYLRFQWMNGKHAPVPFVDGGKMDPENQIKLAMMIAGKDIERVDQAGCWVTCHHDSRYMPHAPDAAMQEAAKDILERLVREPGGGGITKYIKASRTKVEVKGRRGKRRGGWDKLKSEEELKELLDKGVFMDLIRYESSGKVENGHVLASRVMTDKGALSGEGKLTGNMWTVTLTRPLNTGAAGDVTLEPGKTYMVGFAIHDDYADARFHHVSLEYTFGLDAEGAEINAVRLK